MSYQAMSSTPNQSQLCTATPVSSFVQCLISFWLLPSSVATLFCSKFSGGNHMSVAEWPDTYGIHHWRILWRSYRKLSWLRFEPTTTEFCLDAQHNWAIRPWVQVALRANFVQLLQLHCLFSVRFHFGYCLRQSLRWFGSKFSWGSHMSVAEWMIRMVFTTKEFFEEVIESYPEWDLNHDHSLNFVQTL